MRRIIEILKDIFSNRGSVFARIAGAVGPVFARIAGAVGSVFARIGSAVGPVFARIAGAVGSVFARIGSAVGPVFARIAGAVGSVFARIGSAVGPVFARIAGAVGSVFARIGSAVGPVFARIGSAVGPVFARIAAPVRSIFSRIAKAVKPIVSKIIGIVGFVCEIFKDIFSKLWNKIKAASDVLSKKMDSRGIERMNRRSNNSPGREKFDAYIAEYQTEEDIQARKVKEREVYVLKNNNRIDTIVLEVFLALLLIMFIIGLAFFARPDTSDVEKRELTKFPSLSWTTFWNGDFLKGVDTWYADTYPLREKMISADHSLKEFYGVRSEQIIGEDATSDKKSEEKKNSGALDESDKGLEDGTVNETGELQGRIYISGNAGYGLYNFTQDGADTVAETFNQIYKNVGDKVDLYLMVCPISAGVMLDESVLDDMGCDDEKESIKYVYDKLDDGIHCVSIFDKLKAHNAEYIYFRTDHHWTQLGAYYAYQVFCKEKGIKAHKLDQFKKMEFTDFVGTYYSYSNGCAALKENPDTVEAYIPNGTNDMKMTQQNGQTINWKIVNDVTNYKKSALYGAFAGGDNPFTVAHNEKITDGSAVCVVKDSFGNAFIPWLVDHYEYIYWIDYRYTTNTISQMVEDYNVQDVIFTFQIYNATTTGAVDYFKKIGQ